MPDLKELLGEELAGQVQEKLGENHKLIDTKEGNWIPKEKFNEVNEQNKELDKQIKDRDKQLKDLSSKAEGNEELQSQIQELQKSNKQTKEEYEQKLQNQQFEHTLNNSLSGAKVKNQKAVKALLDTESIKLDGDKLLGLDDQLNSIKESDPYLFESEEEGGDGGSGNPQFSGGQHTNQGGGDAFADALLGKE